MPKDHYPRRRTLADYGLLIGIATSLVFWAWLAVLLGWRLG
jgi:hypothetical protein